MSQPFLLNFQEIEVHPGKAITVAKLNEVIPFVVRRVYWVNNLSSPDVSEHAHKALHQIVVAVAGTVTIELEDLNGRTFTFALNRGNVGLYIPPMYWKRIYYNPDLILLCFASEQFNANDYLRDYDTFRQS